MGALARSAEAWLSAPSVLAPTARPWPPIHLPRFAVEEKEQEERRRSALLLPRGAQRHGGGGSAIRTSVRSGETEGALSRFPHAGTPDFRALVGEAAWAALPPALQARFDAAAHRAPRVFPGAMDLTMNWAGWLIARACRLAGTPVAPWRGTAVPTQVLVRAEPGGGIRWQRTYAFPGRPAVTIASFKLAARDGSLLEVTQGGLGMRLVASVEDRALVFRTTGYVWRVGRWLLPIPDVLTPGRALVVHRDLGGGRFHFHLSFTHPLAGETIVNAGDFHDPPEEVGP